MSTTLLRRGMRVRFAAKGQSMQPVIRDGEVITVTPVAVAEVKQRDILLYRTARGLIAHRVVGIERHPGRAAAFTLRGDAANVCDAPVQAEQILGKVVSVQRGARQMGMAGWHAAPWRKIGAWASRLAGRIRRL
ncbi:MAG: signal peptidase I [Candidatus Tectomicrobia bacterium]|nr:signal peptidase I [Candidatus Tectomicrobia bacterium]